MITQGGVSSAPDVTVVGPTITEAETEDEIRACFPVMVQLRPHLSEDQFVERVQRMRAGGYRLLVVSEDNRVRGLAGFRFAEMLAHGLYLYVDDLITDEGERSNGFGALLFDRLKTLAAAEGCEALHLDSGVQRARAHRFYFREGMHIPSYHFSVNLPPTAPGLDGTVL